MIGEPGSGKSVAAYQLVEHLHGSPPGGASVLLVNLSSWRDRFGDLSDFLTWQLMDRDGHAMDALLT